VAALADAQAQHQLEVKKIKSEADFRLQEQAALFEAERGEASLKLADLQGQLNLLRQELEATRQQHGSNADAMNARLKAQHAKLLEEQQVKSDTIIRLTSEVESLQRSIAQSRHDDGMHRERSLQRRQSGDLQAQQELQAAQQDLAKANARLAALQMQVTELQDSMQRQRSTHQSNLSEQLALLSATHHSSTAQLEEQLVRLRTELTQAREAQSEASLLASDKQAELQASIAQLRAQLHQAQSSHTAQVHELESELQQLRDGEVRFATEKRALQLKYEEDLALLKATLEGKIRQLQRDLEASRSGAAQDRELAVAEATTKLKHALDESQALLHTQEQEHLLMVASLKAELASAEHGRQLEFDRAEEHRERGMRTTDFSSTDLEQLRAAKQLLTAELNQLRLKLAEAEAEEEAMRRENQRLRAELAEKAAGLAEGERSVLQRKVAELQASLSSKQGLLRQLEDELAHAQQTHQAALQEKEVLHRHRLEEQQLEGQQAQAKVQDLTEQIERLTAAHQRLAQQLKDLEAERAQQLARTKNIRTEFEAHVSELQSQLDREQTERSRLRAQLLAAQTGNTDDHQTKLIQAQELDQLRDQVYVKDLELMTLRHDYSALRSEHDGTTRERSFNLQAAQADAVGKGQDAAALRAEVAELQQQQGLQLAEHAERLDAVRKQAAAGRTQADAQHREHLARTSELNDQLLAAQSAVSRVSLELQELRSAHDALLLQEARNDRQAQLNVNAQLQKLADQVNQRTHERDLLQQQLEDATSALATVRTTHSEDRHTLVTSYEARVEHLQAQVHSIEAQRSAAAETTQAQLQAQSARFDDLLAQRDADASAVTQRAAELSELCDKLQRDKARMLEQLSSQSHSEVLRERSVRPDQGSGLSWERLHEVEASLRQSRQELTTVQTEADRQQHELQHKLALAGADKNRALAQTADVTAQLQRLQQQFETAHSERTAVVNRFNTELEQLQARLRTLSGERDQARTQLTQSQLDLTETQHNIELLQQRLALADASRDRGTVGQALQAQLAALEAQLVGERRKGMVLEQDLQELDVQLRNSQQAAAASKQQAREAQARVMELEAMMVALQGRLEDESNAERSEKNAVTSRYTALLKDKQQTVEDLRALLRSHESKEAQLQHELDLAQEKLHVETRMHERRVTQGQETNDRDHSARTDDLVRLQARMATMAQEREAGKLALERLQREVDNTRVEHQHTVTEARQDLASLAAQLGSTQDEVEILQQRLRQQQQEHNDQVEAFQRRLAERGEVLKAHTRDVSRLERERGMLQTAAQDTTLTDKLDAAHSKIAEQSDQLSASIAAVKDQNAVILQLRRELVGLQARATESERAAADYEALKRDREPAIAQFELGNRQLQHRVQELEVLNRDLRNRLGSDIHISSHLNVSERDAEIRPEMDDRSAQLRTELDMALSGREAFTAAIAKRLHSLQAQLDDALADNKALAVELSHAQARLRSQGRSGGATTQQQQELLAEIASLRQTNHELQQRGVNVQVSETNVRDTRDGQVQQQLARSVNEREASAKGFQQRLQRMQAQLAASEEERSNLAQQLAETRRGRVSQAPGLRKKTTYEPLTERRTATSTTTTARVRAQVEEEYLSSPGSSPERQRSSFFAH
jgi:chromosome segregation ATPase